MLHTPVPHHARAAGVVYDNRIYHRGLVAEGMGGEDRHSVANEVTVGV